MLFEGPSSGIGELADWGRAAELARQTEVILAGGLSALNVAEAFRRCGLSSRCEPAALNRNPGSRIPRKFMNSCAPRAPPPRTWRANHEFTHARGPRRPRPCQTPGAVSAPSAAVMCRRLWCPRSIGCRLASSVICIHADFQAEFKHELKSWVGRPTALSPGAYLESALGRASILEARRSRAHRCAQDQQRRGDKPCSRSAWAPSE